MSQRRIRRRGRPERLRIGPPYTGEPLGPGFPLDEAIADTGMSREQVERAFRRLVQDGAVRDTGNGTVALLDTRANAVRAHRLGIGVGEKVDDALAKLDRMMRGGQR